MATTGFELQNEPLKGQDGKYQIRIESYDPARNTMKAIWLVSRNQRLLTQLLDKCEVSQTETSNDELRGNLLSVQRELQELREAMDQQDGVSTPVLDTADLGMESRVDFGRSQSSLATVWAHDSPLMAEDDIQVERASSAFGFGSGGRRRSVLSQIPKYSRPSIRTDFCISSYEPFPSIRSMPSHIPKCPPLPKTKKKKGKKAADCVDAPPPRPKTSLSGRGSRLSSYGDRSSSRCTSILKTSHLHVRPATSMALTGTVTKKVSFKDNPVEKPRVKENPSRSRSSSSDQNRKKKTTNRIKTSDVKPVSSSSSAARPATSLGIRSIPRSSSRLSNSGKTASSHGVSGGGGGAKPRSGRHSAMETSSSSLSSTQTRRRTPSGGSGESYTQLYLDARAKTGTKKKTVRDPAASTVATRSTKAQASTPTSSKKKTGKLETEKRPAVVKSRGIETRPVVNRKTTKKKGSAKVKLPVRCKSVSDVVTPRVEVLPFESPPPVPQILSQTDSFISSTDSTLDDGSNPLIRSVSIIDDDSENEDAFQEVKKTLPRIRVGEEPEYRVKAYFLDEIGNSESTRAQSGVIPSSPVELDSTVRDTTSLEITRSEETVTMASDNNSLKPVPAAPRINHVEEEVIVCNNTEGVDKDEIKKELVPETRTQVAEIEEGASNAKEEVPDRDQGDDESALDSPGFGAGFLPEFANEVNGLLDTLMSQDMLMTSFSQDFRLFSTESNFMDASAVATETSTHNSQKQNALEDDKVVKIPEEEELDVIASVARKVEEDPREPREPGTSGEIKPEDSVDVETETKSDRPVMEQGEEVWNDRKGSSAAQDLNDNRSIAGEDLVNGGDEETSTTHPSEKPSTKDAQNDKKVTSNGMEDDFSCGGGLEETSADAISSRPCSALVSPLVACDTLFESEGIQQQRMPIGDALQRKSTGSYDATVLSKSIAAALKPRKLRRSVSQSELDAMLINNTSNNDGSENRTPSPSELRCRIQQLLRWSEAETRDISSHVDPVDRNLDETASVFSSSELTVPDPSETYHDVHHGYSPSFSATAKCTCDESFPPMELVESPTLDPQGASLPPGSFDFLDGNHIPRMASEDAANCTSDLTGFSIPIDPPLRPHSELHETRPTARRPESLDEIEKCSSVDRRSDALFKSTGSSFSVLDSTETHRKVEEGRITQISAMESIGEDSVIPAAVAVDTDEDTVEDVHGNSSDGSIDYTRPRMMEGPTKCEIEMDPEAYTASMPGSDQSSEKRSERTTISNHSVLKPRNGLKHHPASRKPENHQKDKEKQKKKRSWTKSCGIFRLLTCTTSIEKADMH